MMITKGRLLQAQTQILAVRQARRSLLLLLAAALVALVALVVFFAHDGLPRAQASSHVLVSNLEQTKIGGAIAGTHAVSLGFTTGNATGGYTLGSVDLAVQTALDQTDSGKVRAELWSAASGGGPDSRLAVLNVPTSIPAGNVAFTAPPNTTLAASTTYFFVVYTTDATSLSMESTASDDEDSGGAAGWSIANSGWQVESNDPAGATWSEISTFLGTRILLIAVNGPEQTQSSDATLSALTAESSTDGSNFTAMTGADALVPAFDADTTGYRATVGNDVTHVRLTPTVADGTSTVEVGKDGSLDSVNSGTPSNGIALDVGDNEIIVRVTDSNSNTQDYTVTVRRVPSGSVWWATLDVTETSSGGSTYLGCNVAYTADADKCSTASTLTEDEFSVGSQDYEVLQILDRDVSGQDSFFFKLSANTNAELRGLNFCAGPDSYPFSSATGGGQSDHSEVLWQNTEVGWTAGVPVSLSIGTSCAQQAPTLVSNLGKTADATTRSTAATVQLQGFTTGSAAGGYTLSSIEAVINAAPTQQAGRNTIKAELWSWDQGPDSKLSDLTVPAHPITAGTVSFGAPDGTTLEASTKYFLVLYTTGNFNLEVVTTTSDDEDAGGAAGWDIFNWFHSRNSNTPNDAPNPATPEWQERSGTNSAMKISVRGAEAQVQSSDATLSALTAESSSDGTNFAAMTGASALAPAFDAGTTSYRATVGNDVTHVRLTPTVAVSGSTVEVGNDGSLDSVVSGSPSNGIALDVGDNEIIVRVTDSDSNTQDYTVSVRRVPSGSVWWATMTADVVNEYSGCDDDDVNQDDCSAALTDNDFTYGGVTHTIITLYIDSDVEELAFVGNEDLPSDSLVLNVDGTQFSTDNLHPDLDPDEWYWDTTLSWTDGQLVSLSLTPPQASPTDLSALTAESSTDGSTFSAMTGAEALAPAFDAGTTSYRATVGNDVTYVTLSPTLADASSRVYVNWGGNLEQVASGTASQDLALEVGDNEIIVQVTDSSDNTHYYDVTVRRVPAGTEWWATFTPGEFSVGGNDFVGCGSRSTCESQLSDSEFTVGSTTYAFSGIRERDDDQFTVEMNDLSNAQLAALKFCVGATEFSIGSGSTTLYQQSYDVGWTAGVPVSLSIGTSCAPPPPVTLVSNLDQPTVVGSGASTDQNIPAQGFTTGISGGGYSLESVSINWEHYNALVSAEQLRAELWSANPDGGPQSKLAELAFPSSLPASAGTILLQAPPGTTLGPRTTYYLLFYSTIANRDFQIGVTDSIDEDTGGAEDWSIADRSWYADGSDPSTVMTWKENYDPFYPQQLKLVRMSLHGIPLGQPTGPTPTNLTAEPGGGKVTLSWEINPLPNEPGRSRYNIEYGEHPDGPLTRARTGNVYGTNATYPVEGLTPGTTYRFRVQTAGTFGLGIVPSPWSEWVTATPVAPPAPPTDLTIAAGNRQLDLSWTAPAGTLTGYDVHYTASATVAADALGGSGGNPATGWKAIRRGTESDPPEASQTISDLTNLTTYRVRVRAKDATGESAWAYSTGVPVFPTPTGLKVVPGNARLTVSWTAPPVALTGYDVHYTSSTSVAPDAAAGFTPGTQWVAVSRTESDPPTASQTVSSLTNDTAYRVRVRAKDAVGVSPWVETGGTPKATVAGSSDATLSGLALTDSFDTSITFELTPGFDPAKYAYTADVGRDQFAVKVTLGVNQEDATATVNGTAVDSGMPSDAIDLAFGANRIAVRVTAENGTTQDYTLTVTRALPVLKWPGSALTTDEGSSTTHRLEPVYLNDMSGTLTYAAGATNPASVPADLDSTRPTTFTKSADDSDVYVSIAVGSGDDALNEEHETFTVTINPGIGYVVGSPATATVTITDNDPPAAPGDLSLRARDGKLLHSFSKPDGPVTCYQVRWKETSAADQDATMQGDPSTGWVETPEDCTLLEVGPTGGGELPGLTNGTSYDVQVRATDGQAETGNGWGPWSASQQETPMLSADADLSALAAESSSDGNTFATLALDQTFSAATTVYTATVAHEVTHAKLTPTVSDSNASVEVGKQGATLETVASGTASNAIALEVDDNVITVRVTAQNGTTTQDYTVTITRRRSSDATLSGLTASSSDGGAFSPLALIPAFDPAVTLYNPASVANTVTHARLTPTANHPSATIEVNERGALIPVNSGQASNAIPLDVGLNTLSVLVIAQDGVTTKRYFVDVTRRSEPQVSLSVRPNPAIEFSQVTIEATLSDIPGRDVTIPVLLRWGREYVNGQVIDYGDLDQGDLDTPGTASVTEDGQGNRYTLFTRPTFVRVSGGAHQRSYGLQRVGTSRDADTRDETFTVLLDTDPRHWPPGIEPGSPASVRVTVRDRDRFDEPPGPPGNVLAAARNAGLYLTWNPPATGGSAADYEVHYTSRSRLQVGDDAGPVGHSSRGWAASSTGREITGLTNDTFYRVRVRAVNRSGHSDWAFGSGMPRGPEYDPHRDPTRATVGAITVYYDWDPPVDDFRQWQPAHPSHYGYKVRIPGEFSYLDPNDNSVRFALTTHAKLRISVGQDGSTLRVGKVTYPTTDQSDPNASPPVVCEQRTSHTYGSMPVTYWRCAALAAVDPGELSHAIELNAHSPNTHVDIEVTDGEVVKTWLLNIDPPARTYSLNPTARVVEGQEARLTLTLGREAPEGGLEFAVTAAYGTAGADDLGAIASPVTVPEGDVTLEIAVPTVDDERYEGNESFTVSVAPTGSGWAVDPLATGTATVTIEDNEAAPEGPEPWTVRVAPGDGALTVSWTVAPREGVADGEIRHALRWSQTTGADHYWANPRDPRSVGPSDGITVEGGVTSYVITGLENGVATRVDLRSFTGGDRSENSAQSSRWVTEEGEHTTPRAGEQQQQSPPPAGTYSVTAAASAPEGGNAALTITLGQAAPEGGVEFRVAAGYSGAGDTATADDVGAVTSPVTVAQGNTTLDITIPTAADAVDEDDETFTVTIAAVTAGWEKAGDGKDTATVTITDNDTAGVTVNAANPVTVAEGGTATYTVVLTSRPTADVTITPVSGDGNKVSVSPRTNTFTPAEWDQPLTFTVRGVAADDSADERVSIGHGVASSDVKYASVLVNSVAVAVADATADPPQGDQSPQAKYADLIAKVYEWRDDPCCVHNKEHTDRWDRVLLTFGETVADTTLQVMTAAEAQTYVNRGWTRWIEVTKALRELENRAPTVADPIADATIVNESGTHQVSLSGVFDDADNDALTITAVSSDQAVATALAAPDNSTVTVNAHARGTVTVTVTADDRTGGTVSDEFTVTVKAAPEVASPLADASGVEAGSTREVSLGGAFGDADNDALTITAASGDEAIATVTVAADYSALTINGVSEGTATITVTARDSDGNRVSDAFDVSVVKAPEPQDPPNRAPTVANTIADATIVNESGTHQVSLSGVFDDADNDSLTVTAASSDEAVATVSAASDYSSVTITAKSRGKATITVTAKDGRGGTVDDTFVVTVKAAPVVAQAMADISGMTVETSREVSLAGVFSDADGDALTITAASSDEDVAAAYEFDGALTIVGVAAGSATITVTARDADGNRVSDAIDVSVVKAPQPQDPPNRAPTVADPIADATIVNEDGTYQVSLSGVFDDADGDSLTVTAGSSDETRAIVSVASDYSSLTVSAQARGTATITVTAKDGKGGTVEDTFDVRVKAAPVVAQALAAVTGLEVDTTQDVSLSGVFRDADNDELTITATSGDEAIATVTVAADQSKLTLTGVKAGSATITVTARDSDGNEVSDAFDVEVVEAEVAGGGPTPVLNLRCIAETSRVAFLWEAPEWSGGELYAYDYRLTLPGGRSESGRLIGSTLLLRPGNYQQGDEASVSVTAVYETPDGREVSSAAATLTCRVGE